MTEPAISYYRVTRDTVTLQAYSRPFTPYATRKGAWFLFIRPFEANSATWTYTEDPNSRPVIAGSGWTKTPWLIDCPVYTNRFGHILYGIQKARLLEAPLED